MRTRLTHRWLISVDTRKQDPVALLGICVDGRQHLCNSVCRSSRSCLETWNRGLFWNLVFVWQKIVLPHEPRVFLLATGNAWPCKDRSCSEH
jgi:hypothetical protein